MRVGNPPLRPHKHQVSEQKVLLDVGHLAWFEQGESKPRGNNICVVTGMTVRTVTLRRYAPTLYRQAIVALNLVAVEQGVGCRISVTVRLPVRQYTGNQMRVAPFLLPPV